MINFAQPLALLGLAGLAVPLVLHLLNRERPQAWRFPSLRFLRRASLPRQGRQRLRDLVLLALRLLLFACLVLALAGPRWLPPSARNGASAGGKEEIMVFADLSASMGGWGRAARLREAMAGLRAKNPEAAIGLLLADGRPEPVSVAPDVGEAAEKALAGAAPSLFRGRPAAAIPRACALFSAAMAARRLVIISDFQRSDWQAVGPGLIPAGIGLELLDIAGAPPFENAGISSAQVAAGTATGRLRVIAECRNYGSQPARRTLSLRAGDFSAATEIEIPPGESRKTAFTLEKTAGNHGKLELAEADGYGADDSFHLWLGPRPPVQILAVVPLLQEPQKADELFFLQKALAARDAAGTATFNLEHVEPDLFFTLNLQATRAVVLLGGGGHFTAADFARLRGFLEAGGTVVSTPGAAAGHLFRGLRTAGLLNADMHERVVGGDSRAAGGMTALDWVNPEGLLARVFADPLQSGLFSFPLRSYCRLRLNDPAAVPLLRSSQGDPVLLERQVGAGRLFASTMSFDLGGSDLPLTVAFVPLLLELLQSAVPADHGIVKLECGEPVTLPAALVATAAAPVPAPGPELTGSPGVFEFAGRPFQVNVPRAESLPEQELLPALQGRLTKAEGSSNGATETDGGLLPAAAEKPGAGLPLWHWFALAAAAFFVLEMALALMLDRRHSPA